MYREKLLGLSRSQDEAVTRLDHSVKLATEVPGEGYRPDVDRFE